MWGCWVGSPVRLGPLDGLREHVRRSCRPCSLAGRGHGLDSAFGQGSGLRAHSWLDEASDVLLDWMTRMAGRCVQAGSRASFSVGGGRKGCALRSSGCAEGSQSCAEPQAGLRNQVSHCLCSFGERGRCSASVAGWG